ncbi:hypothetical protein Ait01nite_058990 [Actinoplanes italicus]|uniref:histidine kinase n=1 Tax=Actinoplanes italicus TaxID=113567 RepID=A0A2T0K633_9ACTN|nr:ATP-binding protein [Actinoplanes italicus]PRX18442.1 PAS domain S-box-containing protein [Actinoplanes italicus]GIE32854.1 hypothetical protein Ait01nite_058990 [Actinoplanes italicus]
MPVVDEAVLADPVRVAAARRARRVLPGLAMPLDAIAGLAARVTGSAMAIVAVMDVQDEHFVGHHGLPAALATHAAVPVAYSVCKYVVSADHPVRISDMIADPDLRDHRLAVEYGARAFAGVPLRDAADQTVGSLVVVDVVARDFTDAQMALLVEIANLLAGLPAEGVYTDAPAVDALGSAAVLDEVQEAFIAADAGGAVLGWNPAAQGLLGWSAPQVEGLRLEELIASSEQREQWRRRLPRLLTGSGPRRRWSWRGRIRHRDGHEVPVQARVCVLRGAGGPLVCAFLTDITGQQEAERDADDQRGFLNALLDSLQNGVVAVDADARVTVFNRAMRDMHDIGKDWTPQLVDSLFVERVRQLDGTPIPLEQAPSLRALRGEHVHAESMMVTIPGKPTRILTGSAQPIVRADGSRCGAVVTLHDVTDRRRVQRFRDCQLAVEAALSHADAPAHAAPAITRAVAAALGWPHVELWLLDDLTGMLYLAGHHSTAGDPSARPVNRGVVKGTGVTGTVWATVQPMWAPDTAASPSLQQQTPAELHTALAVPIPDSGLALGVLTCYTDSPDHDRTELTTLLASIAEQIGQDLARRHGAELALQIARGQDDFLSLAGHELRTPLTSILANIDVLLDDPDQPAWPHDTRLMMETVARNSDSLRAIIDDLLDLAALESGHLHLSPQLVDLAALTHQSLTTVRPVADANAVTITATVPDALVVTGDPARLRQILDNLLSNAVKYSPDGGHVRLTARRDEHGTTVTVTDTGIGVPEPDRGHLFDRFYRAANARHTNIPGAGLGLAIVRAIVHAHHGTITITHPTDRGTGVTVRLPDGLTP